MDKHIETLNVMESSYAHIRKNDSEYEAIEAAKETLQERAADENGGILMDAKYLAEIEARCEAATPGPWVSIFGLKGRIVYDMSGGNGKVIAKLRNTKHGNQDSDSAFIARARADIPALLAEVERLTIENLGLKDAAIRCDGYEKRYHSALTELDVKNQQIATLKRALEIMHEFMSITEVGSRAKREYFTPDYFIQQAQEQEAHHAK